MSVWADYPRTSVLECMLIVRLPNGEHLGPGRHRIVVDPDRADPVSYESWAAPTPIVGTWTPFVPSPEFARKFLAAAVVEALHVRPGEYANDRCTWKLGTITIQM